MVWLWMSMGSFDNLKVIEIGDWGMKVRKDSIDRALKCLPFMDQICYQIFTWLDLKFQIYILYDPFLFITYVYNYSDSDRIWLFEFIMGSNSSALNWNNMVFLLQFSLKKCNSIDIKQFLDITSFFIMSFLVLV